MNERTKRLQDLIALATQAHQQIDNTIRVQSGGRPRDDKDNKGVAKYLSDATNPQVVTLPGGSTSLRIDFEFRGLSPKEKASAGKVAGILELLYGRADWKGERPGLIYVRPEYDSAGLFMALFVW